MYIPDDGIGRVGVLEERAGDVDIGLEAKVGTCSGLGTRRPSVANGLKLGLLPAVESMRDDGADVDWMAHDGCVGMTSVSQMLAAPGLMAARQ